MILIKFDMITDININVLLKFSMEKYSFMHTEKQEVSVKIMCNVYVSCFVLFVFFKIVIVTKRVRHHKGVFMYD